MTRNACIPDNYDKIIEDVFRTLEKHVIERKSEHVWICKQPGSSNYWFGVALGPGMVTIWGDVAELIFRPHEHYTFGWATGFNPKYPDYPLGKVPSSISITEFSVDQAHAHLRFLTAEDPVDYRPMAEKITEAWDGETQHSWIDAQYSSGCDEPFNGEQYKVSALTSYVCLCWWGKHVREDPVPPA